MADVVEQKIVFKEGDEVRVLRCIIEREDDHFIYIKRNDGNKRIGKQFIIKIEDIKSGEEGSHG